MWVSRKCCVGVSTAYTHTYMLPMKKCESNLCNFLKYFTSHVVWVSVVSCGARGDHFVQTIVRTQHIWKVLLRCVFDNGALIRHFVQNATRIQATDTGMASLLKIQNSTLFRLFIIRTRCQMARDSNAPKNGSDSYAYRYLSIFEREKKKVGTIKIVLN